MKINLGSGNVRYDGFINVDKYDKTADIPADLIDLPFPNDSVDEIKCIQVIEHIPYNQSNQVFKEMYRVLKPGSFVMIETPDIDVVCRKILEEGLLMKWVFNLVGEYYRPWDKERYDDWEMNAASIHRNPWNLERLAHEAEAVGFKVELDDNKEYDYEENLRCKLTKPL